ncbi:phosphate ABC transporter substrate-binding protein PstS family protein [Rhabdothermincola sp.]|uniref:phosphate ABC transporter substrate-binding protein PstS family protein n=1 Tax=Rhabdothermincola sp. TaxID=2820405 RepID=UPI002FE1ACFC
MVLLMGGLALLAAACGGSDSTSTKATTGGAGGKVMVSGSSTVQPISQLVAELFEDAGSSAQITVDGPGTGDGFKLFCNGETDVSDASRPIKKEEADACAAKGIEFIELKIAFDGLTVMTNPANESVDCLAKEDLYAIVGPESRGFNNWKDAAALAAELGSTTTFPDARLDITAPGTESGTYDAFIELATEKIAAKRAEEGKIAKDDVKTLRPDYTSQSNDNAILQAMEGSKTPFGWVGFAFAEEAGDQIKEIAIKDKEGSCISPTSETIADGSYPLSRSLYVYVNKSKAETNAALADYMDFYLSDDGLKAVEEAGYISLPADQIEQTRTIWADRTAGTRDGGR